MTLLRRLLRGGGAGLAVLAALLLLATPARAAAADASLDVSPQAIGVDGWAELTVTTRGGGGGAVTLPRIDGLRLERAGRSSRMEIVNGRTSLSETVHVRAFPERTGTFVIDPADFTVDGRALAGDAVELRVTAAAPAAAGRPDEMASGDQTREQPFLRVAMDRERPFVGERVPVRIEAWFPDGVGGSIDSTPRTESTAFTLNVPEQKGVVSRRLHEGRIYQVMTWDAALVGVRAGEHELPVTVEATVEMPQPRSRRRGSPSPLADDVFSNSPFASRLLDDSFFDDFFRRTVRRKVTLESLGASVEVRSLPTQGRPEGFAGAVGSFTLARGPLPATTRTGDPVTVETAVEGEGNFALVPAPELQADARIKTYAPEAAFEAADVLGRKGRKRFSQQVVVRDPSVDALPPMRLAFFDPHAERYEVVETEAAPIEVTGEAIQDADASTKAEQAVPSDAPRRAPVVSTAPPRAPLVFRSGFRVALGATLGLLVMGAVLTLARARRERDPGRAARRAARQGVRDARRAFDEAAAAGDVRAVLASGRTLLQHVLAASLPGTPASITGEDVRRWMPNRPELADLFDAADAAAFGGHPAPGPDPTPWKQRVLDALQLVENDR